MTRSNGNRLTQPTPVRVQGRAGLAGLVQSGKQVAALLGSASVLALLLPAGTWAAQVIDNGQIITVPGDHTSPWNVGDDLHVGDTSAGTLIIENGGEVANTSGVVGNGAGSTGTATVRGTGSTWQNATSLAVGGSGNGTLTIENGGKVSSNIGYISANTGSTGTVTVRGANSSWEIAGNLAVSQGGNATLLIEDGGTVSNAIAAIATNSGAVGAVTVSGLGSTWTSTNALFVGQSGTGTLRIENGGTVNTLYSFVGNNSGSTGTATVTGTGSTWTYSADFAVGNNGTGTLTIENGASVSSTSGYGGSYAYVGQQAGSSGTVTVRGAGSTWTNSGEINVGHYGSGTLTIAEGGKVGNTDGYIGSAAGSSGTVTVKGSGSTWTSAGNLLAGFYGTGTLTIEDGGTVSSEHGYVGLHLGSSGMVTVRGNGSAWVNKYGLTVGMSGNGALVIENGGTVSNTNAFIGWNTGFSGTVTVRGTGSTWSNSGELNVGYNGTGTLIIAEGGKVGNTDGSIGAAAGSSGTVTVRGTGSTWSNSGELNVGYNGTGTLIIAEGGVVSAGSVKVAESSGSSGRLIIGAAEGQTAVAAGTLAAPTVAFEAGDGAIVFNHTNTDYRFDAAISGAGSVQVYSGTTILTADSSYTGGTVVKGGTLRVNGAITGAVQVEGAGTLGGSGKIGGLVVRSGAALAPGNSIGTMNVNGAVNFEAGSIYQVEVNAAGASDQLKATGAATLNGGTVQVLAENGNYNPSTTYTILTADGGVSGKFTDVSSNFAYLEPTLGYTGNAVSLTLVRKAEPVKPTPVAFNSVAVSSNQYRTADAVEALGAGRALFDAVVGQSAAGARQAFDALSGEAHASAAVTSYTHALHLQSAVLGRLRQPLGVAAASPALHSSVWGEGFGSWSEVDGNGNAARLDSSTGGFVMGADTGLGDSATLGFAGGFARTSFDIDERQSSGSTESIFAALYGSASAGDLTVRLGLSYAWNSFKVSRTIRFPGFSDSTRAAYDGHVLQSFAELGYRVDLGQVQFEPFAGAALLKLHNDSFQETGGAAALTGAAQNQDLVTTTLGLRAEAGLFDSLPLTLRGLLGWRRAYGDVVPESLLAFGNGASAFRVSGAPVDRDALVAEAGLNWRVTEAVSLGVAYSGQIGGDAQDHAVRGNFIWRFGAR